MKAVIQSKTVWLAVLQAVAGVAIVVLTEMDLVGYAAIVKSGLDFFVRLLTEERIDSWL